VTKKVPIGIGAATFVVSAMGFVFTGVESKPPVMIYATAMAVLSLALFGKFKKISN
jgi:hypothetical protein